MLIDQSSFASCCNARTKATIFVSIVSRCRDFIFSFRPLFVGTLRVTNDFPISQLKCDRSHSILPFPMHIQLIVSKKSLELYNCKGLWVRHRRRTFYSTHNSRKTFVCNTLNCDCDHRIRVSMCGNEFSVATDTHHYVEPCHIRIDEHIWSRV